MGLQVSGPGTCKLHIFIGKGMNKEAYIEGYMTKSAYDKRLAIDPRWTDEDARWAASPHAAYHNIMTQRDLDPSRLSKDDMAKLYTYSANLAGPRALPQQLMKQYESNPMYLNKDERARISAHQAQTQAHKKFLADRKAYQAYRQQSGLDAGALKPNRPSAVSQVAAAAPKPQQPQSPAMHNLKTFKMQDPRFLKARR
jgi:hypothetical protein